MMITVRVQPNAKQDLVVGFLADGSLKLRVSAPPEDGRANESVRKLLSEVCGVKKQDIVLVSGFAERIKRLELPAHAYEKLNAKFAHVQALDLFRPLTTDDNA
jgi:uncharacterized protein (TIGR00251 family)